LEKASDKQASHGEDLIFTAVDAKYYSKMGLS
jgi:hypothetical protein